MDYNNFDKNNRRKAQSISDMLNGNGHFDDSSRRNVMRSNYKGPKAGQKGNKLDQVPGTKTRLFDTASSSSHIPDASSDRFATGSLSSASTTVTHIGSGGVGGAADYLWIVYVVVLAVCIIACIVIYGASGVGTTSSSKGHISVKYVEEPSFWGIIPELRKIIATGQKSDYFITGSSDGTSSSEGTLGENETTESVTSNGTSVISTSNTPDTAPITTSGNAMVLDSGQGLDGYTEATSHSELLNQLEGALASSDIDFVGMKIGYTDDSGNLSGYPQSVVEHFVKYMSANGDKRAAFINEVSDESFSMQNSDAYIVVLPLIKFTVENGYDGTDVAVDGFGDQVMNAGQKAEIKPLLPCMYTVTASNGAWSEDMTRELEANISERAYIVKLGTN